MGFSNWCLTKIDFRHILSNIVWYKSDSKRQYNRAVKRHKSGAASLFIRLHYDQTEYNVICPNICRCEKMVGKIWQNIKKQFRELLRSWAVRLFGLKLSIPCHLSYYIIRKLIWNPWRFTIQNHWTSQTHNYFIFHHLAIPRVCQMLSNFIVLGFLFQWTRLNRFCNIEALLKRTLHEKRVTIGKDLLHKLISYYRLVFVCINYHLKSFFFLSKEAIVVKIIKM